MAGSMTIGTRSLLILRKAEPGGRSHPRYGWTCFERHAEALFAHTDRSETSSGRETICSLVAKVRVWKLSGHPITFPTSRSIRNGRKEAKLLK